MAVILFLKPHRCTGTTSWGLRDRQRPHGTTARFEYIDRSLHGVVTDDVLIWETSWSSIGYIARIWKVPQMEYHGSNVTRLRKVGTHSRVCEHQGMEAESSINDDRIDD